MQYVCAKRNCHCSLKLAVKCAEACKTHTCVSSSMTGFEAAVVQCIIRHAGTQLRHCKPGLSASHKLGNVGLSTTVSDGSRDIC